MVVSYFGVTFVHLLLSDGRQRSPRQLQSAHNSLKTLKCQRRTVVVHLYYPVATEKEENLSNTQQHICISLPVASLGEKSGKYSVPAICKGAPHGVTTLCSAFEQVIKSNGQLVRPDVTLTLPHFLMIRDRLY